VTEQVREAIRWSLLEKKEAPIRSPEPSVVVQTDAFKSGGGGNWGTSTTRLHLNWTPVIHSIEALHWAWPSTGKEVVLSQIPKDKVSLYSIVRQVKDLSFMSFRPRIKKDVH